MLPHLCDLGCEDIYECNHILAFEQECKHEGKMSDETECVHA